MHPIAKTAIGALLLCACLHAQGIGGKAGFGGKAGIGGGAVSGSTTFTAVQSNSNISLSPSSDTTISVTLTSAPTAGNNVTCLYYTYNEGDTTAPTVTVADNAGTPNNYTVETPVTNGAGGDFIGIAYLLSAPSGAGSTVTATFSETTAGYAYIGCFETHRSSGTWTFDSYTTTPSPAGGTSSGSGVITSPSCTVTGANDFLYSGAWGQAVFNTPTAGSPWTIDAGVVSNVYIAATYDLAATTTTAMNLNSGTASSFSYSGVCVAFK